MAKFTTKKLEIVPILKVRTHKRYSSQNGPVSPSFTLVENSVEEGNQANSNDVVLNNSQRCIDICPEPQYLKGLGLLGIVTLFFASYSPSIRAMFVMVEIPPPVLAWNAGVALIGFISSVLHRPFVKNLAPFSNKEHLAGLELGFWCFLGATVNCLGLSFTTADQAAFCVQTTTVIVPLIQGVMGLPVSGFVWLGCILSIIGAYALIKDSASQESAPPLKELLIGNACCIGAAICYSLFDIRLNQLGKSCEFLNLAYTKMGWYALFSVAVVFAPLLYDSTNYISDINQFLNATNSSSLQLVLGVMIYQGVVIQFLVTLLLIPGQDIVGAARAQIIYAMAPLLTALISWLALGETLGYFGMIGATIFMLALLVAIQNPPDQSGH